MLGGGGGYLLYLLERETFIYFHKVVLTFCIHLTRGMGGHKPPRWIRALVKETGDLQGL